MPGPHNAAMQPSSAPLRFKDPRRTKYHVISTALVQCPACEKIAHVVTPPDLAGAHDADIFAPKRLVCRACGLTKEWRGRRLGLHRDRYAVATDPYFDVRLWLQTETRHGRVWAYNLEHLDLLKRFVGASLREGVPWDDHGRKMTVVARLPAWMQQAKNRDDVLRAIRRIHASLLDT